MSDRIRLRDEKPVTIRGKRYLQIPIFEFDELSEKAKQNALNKGRAFEIESDFWKDDEGLFRARQMNGVDAGDVFADFEPTEYDLDRGTMNFGDIYIKDEKKFFEFAGVPYSLSDKIDFDIDSSSGDTFIVIRGELFDDFTSYTGTKNYDEYRRAHQDAITSYHDYAFDDVESKVKGYILTRDEFSEVMRATQEVDDFLDDTVNHYRDAYNYAQSDENVSELLRINEYEFDKHGDFA